MRVRAMWSGSLSFGLVNIPVRLYKAADERGLSFEYLHEKDLSPVRYAKICRAEEREITQDEIVKGFEYEKGRFVVMNDEDFEKADVRRSSSIEIQGFASKEEIDSVYFEKPYYLEPQSGAEKAYAILREALKRSDRVGLAKYAIRNREHLALIKPEGDVLLLDQMRFASQIRDVSGLNLPSAEVPGEEIELAMALIDRLTGPFSPESYRDTYSERLMEVIDEKAKGKVISIRGERPEPTEVADLMATLKASLQEAEKRAG